MSTTVICEEVVSPKSSLRLSQPKWFNNQVKSMIPNLANHDKDMLKKIWNEEVEKIRSEGACMVGRLV